MEGPRKPSRGALAPLFERARSAQAGFDCRPRRDGDWELRLWGFLPVDWCGNLSLQCCAAGVDIASAEAQRVGAARWAARLRLRPPPSGGSLSPLDFLRMARHRPRVAGRDIPIELFSLDCRRGEGSGASVRVAVRGPDRLGFLAELLGRFALRALYPHRLQIRTEDAIAEDVFWLRGAGDLPPAERAVAALESDLRPTLVTPRSGPG